MKYEIWDIIIFHNQDNITDNTIAMVVKNLQHELPYVCIVEALLCLNKAQEINLHNRARWFYYYPNRNYNIEQENIVSKIWHIDTSLLQRHLQNEPL